MSCYRQFKICQKKTLDKDLVTVGLLQYYSCECPGTRTRTFSSTFEGPKCTQCLPLLTCTPTCPPPPNTRAFSVHPGPCNGNPRPTIFTSVSSSCCIFCDSCICFMVFPLLWLRNHSKLGVSGLCFLLMQDFHTC